MLIATDAIPKAINVLFIFILSQHFRGWDLRLDSIADIRAMPPPITQGRARHRTFD